MANGEQMVVGGLMREIIETLYARGYVPELLSPKRWRQEAMKWTPFDAEGLKLLLDELAAEAGVEVRFFTRAIDVDMSADGARARAAPARRWTRRNWWKPFARRGRICRRRPFPTR